MSEWIFWVVGYWLCLGLVLAFMIGARRMNVDAKKGRRLGCQHGNESLHGCKAQSTERREAGVLPGPARAEEIEEMRMSQL